jgi:DNA (cytosine-5)-methyltransferase 1
MDMPSKTIKAGVHGISGREGTLRELDGTVRYLTVREAALVQGFPNDYEFPGYRSRVMVVIGNAVAHHTQNGTKPDPNNDRQYGAPFQIK